MRSATSALLRIAQMSEGVLQCGPTHTHTRTHARAGAGLPSTPDCGLRCMGSSGRTRRSGLVSMRSKPLCMKYSLNRSTESRTANTQTHKHTNKQHNTTLCKGERSRACTVHDVSCRGALCCCCLFEPCCSTLYWAATRWSMVHCCSSSRRATAPQQYTYVSAGSPSSYTCTFAGKLRHPQWRRARALPFGKDRAREGGNGML
jgi:hypothetical protein